MIGELIQGILKETFDGNENVASLPYRLSVVFAGSVNALGTNDLRQEAHGPLGP